MLGFTVVRGHPQDVPQRQGKGAQLDWTTVQSKKADSGSKTLSVLGWGCQAKWHLKGPRKGSASRAHLLKVHKSFPSEEGWGLSMTGGEGVSQ